MVQVDKDTILRAWKSQEYRDSLPAEVKDAIPARPTGRESPQLTDEELQAAVGAFTPASKTDPGTPSEQTSQ